MAITTNQQPSTYTPAYNGQWFESTSSNSGQPNFVYTVKCTDLITSETATYQIKKGLSSEMVFDAANFSKKYIEHYIPNNVYGWQVCTDAVRSIRVNIGETFGTTPAYASGANIDYFVWNGVLKFLDWPSYNQADYVYTNAVPFKYLFSGDAETGYKMPRGTTYDDKSLYLYFLSDVSNTLETLRIRSYDSAGNLLGTSNIANPYYNDATYTNKYECIDVGKKGLDNIASGLVTGTYPILPVNCDYYIIYDVNSSVGTPPAGTVEPIRRIDILDECRYEVYTLQYVDKDGNVETLHCSKVSEITVQADKTYYKQTPYRLVSNNWEYNTFTSNEFTLNSNTTTRLKLNTDWMSEEDADRYRYLISSPRVYLDMGRTIGLVPVRVNTNNWVVNKKWNKRLYNVTLDIEYTHVDTYQNG
jgi:hypothetical protein